jgi:hypothetical protein
MFGPGVYLATRSLSNPGVSASHRGHDLCPRRHRLDADRVGRLHPAQRHPGGQSLRARAELRSARGPPSLLLPHLHPGTNVIKLLTFVTYECS